MIRKFGGSSGVEFQPAGIDLGVGGGSNIKSIQQGYGTFSNGTNGFVDNNITIASVDPNSSIILISHAPPSGGTAPRPNAVAAKINGAEQISIVLGPYANNVTVYWQVVEFNNVKSKQSGFMDVVAGGLTTITINPVNLSKAFVIVKNTSYYSSTDAGGMQVAAYFNSNYQLRLGNGAGGSTVTIYWQVIEFN